MTQKRLSSRQSAGHDSAFPSTSPRPPCVHQPPGGNAFQPDPRVDRLTTKDKRQVSRQTGQTGGLLAGKSQAGATPSSGLGSELRACNNQGHANYPLSARQSHMARGSDVGQQRDGATPISLLSGTRCISGEARAAAHECDNRLMR